MTIADVDYHDYFSPGALKKLQEAYHSIDLDGDGILSNDELMVAFRRCGRNLTKQQVRELVKAVDTDENGSIDFEEFCLLEIMISGCRPHVCLLNYRDYLADDKIQTLERRFVQEDIQGLGALPVLAVTRICEDLGCKEQKGELQDLFKQADVAGAGVVDFRDLCAIYAVATKCRRKCNYREFLSPDQVATFRKVFANSIAESGHCGIRQLDKLLRRLGMPVKQRQLQYLMDSFDTDASGDIDFEEFCIMLCRLKGLRRQQAIGPNTHRCEDLWRKEGFTVKELQTSGFTLEHFKEVGIPVSKLLESGVSALDFRRAGYTSQDLRRGGVSAADLRRSGFSLADLRLAGFSGPVLRMADTELKGSLSAGDLSLLPQHRPHSGRSGGPPVRGAVLSSAGVAALQQPPNALGGLGAVTCPWKLPPRPMTQMIREHTDWQPKLSCALPRIHSEVVLPDDWRPTLH